jgi:EmrB/QacA subfamily drug resistance transporter
MSTLPSPSAPSRRQTLLTVVGMLLAIFLAALDQTVVATAGPSILRALQLDPGLYTWITTSYLVASTVLVPLFGRLSDLHGRRRVVVWGVLLFVAGSAACGLATTPGQLIAFRALQGSGSACIFTSAFALVADLFTPRERGRYSGLFGSVFAVSSLAGPVMGGLITDTLGWRWVFWANVPLGLLALAVILRWMPPLVPRLARRPTVDWWGTLLLAVGTVPLLVGLSLGRNEVEPGEVAYLWNDPLLAALFAVAAAGLTAFVWWELRTPEPLMDLWLFRDPTVRWGAAAVFVLGGAFLAPMVFLPLFMVNVVGVTATASGLTVTPLVLGVLAGNLVSGVLVSRLGRYRELMLGSLALLVVGAAVLAFTLTASTTFREVAGKLLLLGLGLGPSIPLYTIALQDAVPEAEVGVATSLVTFARQLGQVVGVAVAGSLFAATLSTSLHARLAEATARLPPSLGTRLRARPAAPPGPGERVSLGDASRLRRQALDELEGARRIAHQALEGDALARALVRQSPFADEALKRLAAAGGVAAAVAPPYQALAERLEVAAQSPPGWAALVYDASVAPALRAVLAGATASALADPRTREPALDLVRAALENARAEEVTRRLVEEGSRVDAALARVEGPLLEAIDGVALAMRESFTLATRRVQLLALGLAVLALALTLRMPRRVLSRGREAVAVVD